MITSALMCMALNVFFEARNQPTMGMEAVANVTMSRADYNPSNVCRVVTQNKQFTWTINKKINSKDQKLTLVKKVIKLDKESWKKSLTIAKLALDNKLKNHVNNALFYYNPDKLKHKPNWVKKMTVVAVIGDHVFLKDPNKTHRFDYERHRFV